MEERLIHDGSGFGSGSGDGDGAGAGDGMEYPTPWTTGTDGVAVNSHDLLKIENKKLREMVEKFLPAVEILEQIANHYEVDSYWGSVYQKEVEEAKVTAKELLKAVK